jgi:formylmethanofuran dehydrogenase subunit E
MMERALKEVSRELREELLWSDRSSFLLHVWSVVRKELGLVDGGKYSKFKDMVLGELESRNWSVYSFRNKKNEPITNVFKKVLRILAKEEGWELTNDSLSRILNAVRKSYGNAGILRAFLFPPVAFREREKWGILWDLGDYSSCFMKNGVNEGNVDWLINEYEEFGRAYFIVFKYENENEDKIGFGRCWAFKVDGAVYLTNFYSDEFDIKLESFRLAVVELVRELFDMSGEVKYDEVKYRDRILPIYLNGDGIIVWEPSVWEDVVDVVWEIENLWSRCLWCKGMERIKFLTRNSERVEYNGREVEGLIVCKECVLGLNDDRVECIECGRIFYEEDVRFLEDGPVCRECFYEHWFYCSICEEVHRREHAVVDRHGNLICEDCAEHYGVVCDCCGRYTYYERDEVSIKEYKLTDGYEVRKVFICDECMKKEVEKYECKECGEEVYYLKSDYVENIWLRDMEELNLCIDCYFKEREEYRKVFDCEEQLKLF